MVDQEQLRENNHCVHRTGAQGPILVVSGNTEREGKGGTASLLVIHFLSSLSHWNTNMRDRGLGPAPHGPHLPGVSFSAPLPLERGGVSPRAPGRGSGQYSNWPSTARRPESQLWCLWSERVVKSGGLVGKSKE